jgi:tripartite-type tricarboxylate transporter receptor subunit TctC
MQQLNRGASMEIARRQLLQLAGATAAAPMLSKPAVAVDYPTRPIRLVIGFAAGGAVDTVVRIVGQWLSERLGQQVVIESRPGAGSNVATEAVVNAKPDGYTLLLITPANTINVTLYKKLNFDFLRGIVPVAGIIRVPNLMSVSPTVPATTVPEFIEYAKANPGKLSYASSGNGTSVHLAAELFKMMTKVDLQNVTYRGMGGGGFMDLMTGRVHVTFNNLPATIGYVRGGKLRALAVTTQERSEALPDVPPMSDFLPGFEASGWYGIGAPRNTPAEMVNRLNAEMNAGLADPKIRLRLVDIGGMMLPGSPAEFEKFIIDDVERWAKVVNASGAKAE